MRIVIAAAIVALAPGAVGAAVLYKLTDPLGRITYADTVPRGFDGTVRRLDVDTTATAVSPARIPEILAAAPSDTQVVIRRTVPSTDDRLRAAQLRVDAARAALEDARNNSTAEDWQYFARSHPSGGRRVPRPEYQARLERLEQEVAVAEEAYDAVRRDLR